MTDLATLAQTVGLPIAMLLIALVTGSRGVWVWGSQLREEQAETVRTRAECEARLEAQRLAHVERERELAEAAARWERMLFALVPELSKLTAVVAKKGAGS